MAIRPQAEIDEETRQQTFKDALEEKNREEEEQDEPVVAPIVDEPEDIEVVEGEPEPEGEPDKLETDNNSNISMCSSNNRKQITTSFTKLN